MRAQLHPAIADEEDAAGFFRRISSAAAVISLNQFRAETDPKPPIPAEACTELGAETAPAPPSAWVRARICLLESRLATLIDEQRRYERAGLVGQVYQLNSLKDQIQLMARIASLKGLSPINTETGVRP